MKKHKLLISTAILPLCICGLTSISSCNNHKTDEITFATDSWDNIISYANQGIKALVDHYKPNGGTFIITPLDITPEQIAAKTRTIHIDNYGDFKVRVTGECIDKIDDNNNAALTFEFAEIITKECFQNDLTKTNPANYLDSHIRTKLYEILNNFPSALKDNIQTIKQTTAVINDESNYDSVVSDEKLFLMSLDEHYGVCAETEAAVIYENHCYQYYQYSTHQATSAHIKPFYNSTTNEYENCAYWLKTPVITEEEYDNTVCYNIDDDGCYNKTKVNTSLGISPCFCLGKEKAGIINIGCATAGFEFCSSQIVDSNQDITIKIKPKTYQNHNVCKMPDNSDEGKAQFKIFGEDGRIYNDNFLYDNTTGEVKFIQNRINKSLVFEMWNSQIDLDYKTFVNLCNEDEQNNKNGNLVLNYFNVGNWFNIVLDNTTYKLNIIGINHDFIDNNKKAAVTLEFFNTIEGYKWDDNGKADYLTSSLNKNLNGSEESSIINKLNKSCSDLASGMKNIHKNVFVKRNNAWVVQDMTTKLFILSDDEMLASSGVNADKLGKQYDFYSFNIDDIDLLSRQGQEIWTRSAYTAEEQNDQVTAEEQNDQVLVLRKEQSHLLIEPTVSNQEYTTFAPAFCI